MVSKREVLVCKKHKKNNAEKNPNNTVVTALVCSVDDSLINDV